MRRIRNKTDEKNKKRGIWTTTAEWLKKKGNHSVVLPLKVLMKIDDREYIKKLKKFYKFCRESVK